MNKRRIDVAEVAGDIVKALPAGILMTTKAGDKVNSMVIGWGMVGYNWRKHVFAAVVRESRFTRTLVDANPEFTINIPVGPADKKAIAVCGAKSGRDMDKIAEAGLTLVDPEVISVPGIKEFPLTLECRVMYRQEQDPAGMIPEMIESFYPVEESGKRDLHTTYIAEIVDCYMIED
ncbi:MAG: flavin reductase family protein [Clostridium sp.]|nr:flavin reductase family protein [Clostridium sp.]